MAPSLAPTCSSTLATLLSADSETLSRRSLLSYFVCEFLLKRVYLCVIVFLLAKETVVRDDQAARPDSLLELQQLVRLFPLPFLYCGGEKRPGGQF